MNNKFIMNGTKYAVVKTGVPYRELRVFNTAYNAWTRICYVNSIDEGRDVVERREKGLLWWMSWE